MSMKALGEFSLVTGGVRPDNDLVAMAKEFAARIHFLHLRATKREADAESGARQAVGG